MLEATLLLTVLTMAATWLAALRQDRCVSLYSAAKAAMIEASYGMAEAMPFQDGEGIAAGVAVSCGAGKQGKTN